MALFYRWSRGQKNEGIWLDREKDRVKDGHGSDNVEEDWKKKRWMIRRTEVTKREQRNKQLTHQHTGRT